MPTWREIHLTGLAEAERLFIHLGIDKSIQVDPFASLAKLGVPVIRRRLDKVAGLYLPGNVQGSAAAGVMVNVVHPLSKQRFTAAHELCHHLRDRTFAIDLDTELFDQALSGASPRERIAETFAAWFLMPKQLVKTVFDSMDIKPNSASPVSIYEASLRMGTSYRATVNHLSDMRFVTRGRADELLRTTPRQIKTTVGARDALAGPRHDVWLVADPLPSNLVVTKGDAVVCELDEVPSSGHTWGVSGDTEALELAREEFLQHMPDAVGGSGKHRFIFQAKHHGLAALNFTLARPWSPEQRLAGASFGVVVENPPEPGLVNADLVLSGRA